MVFLVSGGSEVHALLVHGEQSLILWLDCWPARPWIFGPAPVNPVLLVCQALRVVFSSWVPERH
jgi:hypothetical protein